MILLAFDRWDNEDSADHLDCARHAVGIWRRRWAAAFQRLVLLSSFQDSYYVVGDL
jgi:hypothetical protein